MTSDTLLAGAARAAQVAAGAAADGERQRRLPTVVVDALRDEGLLRMAVPTAYGGPAADPLTIVRCIERIAIADGAAGWCCMIASTTSSLAAYLPPESAREIFSDPRSIAGGVFAPNGRATAHPDGWIVDGRWMWGSGTQHCDWIVGGATTDGGPSRLMFFPTSDVEFHDTWHTHGLRGTGSLDFSVASAVVPERRSIASATDFSLLAIGVAAVALGIARRAVDELVGLAGHKRPQFSQRTVADTGTAQADLARAEARLAAARAYLFDEVAAGTTTRDLDQRVRIRLAAAHAAASAADVVDEMYSLAGGTAVFESSVLQRCLRDAHVVTQHIMVSRRIFETLGKHLFGHSIDAGMI